MAGSLGARCKTAHLLSLPHVLRPTQHVAHNVLQIKGEGAYNQCTSHMQHCTSTTCKHFTGAHASNAQRPHSRHTDGCLHAATPLPPSPNSPSLPPHPFSRPPLTHIVWVQEHGHIAKSDDCEIICFVGLLMQARSVGSGGAGWAQQWVSVNHPYQRQSKSSDPVLGGRGCRSCQC